MPRASSWPACRTAEAPAVVRSALIDTAAVLSPAILAVTVRSAPAIRLAEAIASLILLVGLLTAHCVAGRGLGGLALGLRCVDDAAGLPPASPIALLAVVHAGHYRSATVYDVRHGADPSRGTLRELSAPARHAAPPTAPVLPAAPEYAPTPYVAPLNAVDPVRTPVPAPPPPPPPLSFAPATRRPRLP
ncbi:hypothetical protein [Actinomyces respiraculi]|uniref:hypothetical protein n=1 Tax=Actinomyces respiraculi TaxID=2744574 RepID=UPI001421634B|nr:hypothetical protein [Actinomyces respiraculi]